MSFSGNDLAFQRNLSVLEAAIGTDHVLFHTESGKYCRLNGSGNDVWDILVAPHTLAQLGEALSQKYAVDQATCQTDVLTFLEKLKDSDFISSAEPSLAKAAH
jgi:hypothetical protein